MPQTIFISYERSDRAIAQPLAEALEQSGWAVWWDRKLLAGDRFDSTIQQALNDAGCVIVLWSKTSVLSDWVKDEATEAMQRGILVPVLVDDVEIPLGFRRLHTVRVTDWNASSPSSELPELVASVRHLLDRPHKQKDGAPVATSATPIEPAHAEPRTASTATDRAGAREDRAHPTSVVQWMSEAPAVLKLGAAALAILVVSALYWRSGRVVEPASPSAPADTRAPAVGTAASGLKGSSVATNSPLTPPAFDGLASSGLDFSWPGSDCWDIFRGDKLVTYKCGADSQALQAGTYLVKPKHAPLFKPFEVVIKAGAPTRVELGGVFAFTWPGSDCWDVFRGEQLVTYKCGTDKQALEPGNYTIKAKHAAVFTPFDMAVKARSMTQISMGGVFVSTWGGSDCWDIFRGGALVTYGCGAGKQALQAGKYSVKPKHAPVFAPFDLTIADGVEVKSPL